jgi:hypothetical protein
MHRQLTARHIRSIQGDIDGWNDMSDPLSHDTSFNQTGLVRSPFILE